MFSLQWKLLIGPINITAVIVINCHFVCSKNTTLISEPDRFPQDRQVSSTLLQSRPSSMRVLDSRLCRPRIRNDAVVVVADRMTA